MTKSKQPHHVLTITTTLGGTRAELTRYTRRAEARRGAARALRPSVAAYVLYDSGDQWEIVESPLVPHAPLEAHIPRVTAALDSLGAL